MNLSANAAEDYNRSHQNKGRNKDGSRTKWKAQPTFIKGTITSLKEKWFHGYHNMTVMNNSIKITLTNIPQNVNSQKTSMMLVAKIYGNS